MHRHHVANGHGRKIHAVGLAGTGLRRGGAGGAAATAQHVDANDEEFVRVNRLARADVVIPPAGAAGLRIQSGDVLVLGGDMGLQPGAFAAIYASAASAAASLLFSMAWTEVAYTS